MSVFDKLFKPNKFDETMDHVFEDLAENDPVSKRAKSIIEEAADNITNSLEHEVYGKTKERPEGRPSVLEDYDSVSAEWDGLIDQLFEGELASIRSVPTAVKPHLRNLRTVRTAEPRCRKKRLHLTF